MHMRKCVSACPAGVACACTVLACACVQVCVLGYYGCLCRRNSVRVCTRFGSFCNPWPYSSLSSLHPISHPVFAVWQCLLPPLPVIPLIPVNNKMAHGALWEEATMAWRHWTLFG